MAGDIRPWRAEPCQAARDARGLRRPRVASRHRYARRQRRMRLLTNLLRSALIEPLRKQALAKRHLADLLRALRKFQRDPDACADPGSPLLACLVRLWGNQPWAAEEEYLAASIKEALAAKGAILECGSGLSTILIGMVAQRTGSVVWSLENEPGYGAQIKAFAKRRGLESVNLHVAPLRDYGEFDWYDPPLERMPERFSLILCDGPNARTRGGRCGMLPVMRTRLDQGCVILLDDARRDAERAIASTWATELSSSFEVRGVKKPYARLVVLGHGTALRPGAIQQAASG